MYTALVRAFGGLEFFDFRRYRPGDDFRHIDWNSYSRLDRLFLKLYTAEEDLTLYLLLDASASMGFGEPRKFDHARRLAAALAYIGLNNLDRVGLAASTTHRLLNTLEQHGFAALDADRGVWFIGVKAFTVGNAFLAGLVVLISDLLGDDGVQNGLDALRRTGHEVTVVQLLAEEELAPPLDGVLSLIDAETGGELKVTVDAELRALYRARLEQHLNRIERDCRRRRFDYLRASTAIPFEDVVLNYLRRAGRLR